MASPLPRQRGQAVHSALLAAGWEKHYHLHSGHASGGDRAGLPSAVVGASVTAKPGTVSKNQRVYTALGDLVPAVVENALSLELANGSRIVTLPGKEATVRGFSVPSLVIEDESARVPDELHQAIRPMLAVSQGRLVLLSSPFGKRGHFYEAWELGGPDWYRVKVTAYDVPRIAPAWLEQERAAIGGWWFQQEYLCEFVQTDDAYFDAAVIARAFDDGIPTLFPLEEVADDVA